jgi:flagellar basal body P-ring formation protein FlgA
MRSFLLSTLFAALASTTALAAPVLRAEVSVTAPIVTVGDMFADAGPMATTPLFRAPKPGTAGVVSLAEIDAAAARIGFAGYAIGTVDKVRVLRDATRVDATMLSELVSAAIDSEGLRPEGTVIDIRLADESLVFNAEMVAEPVRLLGLDYRAGASRFAARFAVAGEELPVEVAGRVTFLVEAPHLISEIKAGEVLDASDIEMRLVPADFADRSGVAHLDELLGMAMKRNARAGLMLKTADVSPPLAVKRNAQVTVLIRAGAMTLTMQGQSLGDAGIGAPVRVMNPVSNKVLSGVATAPGTVEIHTGGVAVAALQ